MAKKLVKSLLTPKHSHIEQSTNLNENISQATMSLSKKCRTLSSSVTTFNGILTNPIILEYLYTYGIKTTWLKYTKTLI